MKKIFMSFVVLLAIAAASMSPARAQSTSSLVFEAKCNGSGTANDGVQWTVTSDGAESNFDNNRGIHYGTNNATVGYIELSTSGITGTITQVMVNAAKANGVTATVSVTVGGNAFGTTQSMSSNNPTDYTFTGSASGAIVVRVAKPLAANKALYVKSIEVTYTPAPSGGGSEPYDFTDAPTLTIGVNAENRGSVEMLIGTIWDSATWHGWENVIPVNRSASNITLTSVGEQYLHAYQYTYSGLNQGALTLRAKEDENGDATAQQLILTSNANNFQRIEFLMTRDYAAEDYHPMNDLSAWVNKNPNIVPSTGWTFGGKKAIWQGNANSITMTSCSTYVHQILFTREGDSALVQTSEVANEFKIVSGNEMNVRAMANEGYHLSGWSNGFPVNASQTARVNVVSDTTLRAIFDTNEYVLTVAVAAGQEAMGSVNGSNPAAKHFREYTISATPMPGYLFKQWNDGVTTDSRTVTLTKDMTYTATFVVDTFTLTVNATPDTMGTVTLSAGAGSLPEGVVDNGDGTYRVPYLTQLVAQAVPNSHHHVTGWNTGSVSADMQYDTIVMGAADASLTASFAIDNYTITLVNAVPQAPLPTAVTDNGNSTYTAPYGTEMTIEPVVPQYMLFTHWVGGGTNYDNPRTVTFDQDITYEATFSQQLYNIFASSSDTAKGTVNASYRSGYYGQTRNFTATPKADYAFVNWTEADTVYSTDATIDVVVLGHTRRLTANFAFPNPNPYTVRFASGNDGWTVTDVTASASATAPAVLQNVMAGDSLVVTAPASLNRKVKSVKAVKYVPPAATVTTAPTATAALVGTYSSSALVNAGAANGGTMMYAVTTTNAQPASTADFSATIPTAQDRMAGTYYVWYYAKADAEHSDSEIAGPVSVTLVDMYTVTWNSTNVFNSAHENDKITAWQPGSLTFVGITISKPGAGLSSFKAYDNVEQTGELSCYGNNGDSFTFTAPSGKKFCKIEIINNYNWGLSFTNYGDWTQQAGTKVVWSGTAANAVTLGTVYTAAPDLNSIVFTLIDD